VLIPILYLKGISTGDFEEFRGDCTEKRANRANPAAVGWIQEAQVGAKERVAKLLKAWLKSGALVEVDRPNPKRTSRNRPTIIVGVRAT
jgi:hypothetical protein